MAEQDAGGQPGSSAGAQVCGAGWAHLPKQAALGLKRPPGRSVWVPQALPVRRCGTSLMGSAERRPHEIHRGKPYLRNSSFSLAVTYLKNLKQVVFQNPDLEQTEYSETGKPQPDAPHSAWLGRGAAPQSLGARVPASWGHALRHNDRTDTRLVFSLKSLETARQRSEECHRWAGTIQHFPAQTPGRGAWEGAPRASALDPTLPGANPANQPLKPIPLLPPPQSAKHLS